MVPEADRLCSLQMRVAGHNCGGIFLSLICKRGCHRTDLLHNDLGFVAEIHTEIERDLIVSAARGVELLAHVAKTRRQHALDEHMNILGGHIDLELAFFNVCKNAAETLDELFCLIEGDNALLCEHSRVRHTARDILFIHTAVNRDRRIEIICNLIRLRRRSAFPKFCHKFFPFLMKQPHIKMSEQRLSLRSPHPPAEPVPLPRWGRLNVNHASVFLSLFITKTKILRKFNPYKICSHLLQRIVRSDCSP